MQSPRLVVGVLIEKDGKYLLAKESLKSGEFWLIPGGGVEFGETLEQAAQREMKEELGVDIEIQRFISFREAIRPAHDYHSVIFFFLAHTAGTPIMKDESMIDLQYFTREEALKLNLIFSARELFENDLV